MQKGYVNFWILKAMALDLDERYQIFFLISPGVILELSEREKFCNNFKF